MIKKDIDLNAEVTPTKKVVSNVEHADEVDKIFADADRTMEIDNNSLLRPKEKKKKKKHKALRILLLSLLIIVLFIAGSIGMFLYTAHQSFPMLKSNLIYGLQDAQIQLLEIEDSTLSPIDLCGKKIILLISVNKIDQNIQDIFDLFEFTNDMNKGLKIDDTFVEEQDKEEFNRLLQEYKALEEAGYKHEQGHVIVSAATWEDN